MADTSQSTAALLAASADNTTGNWTNADERQFIVSAMIFRPGGYVASETYHPGNQVIGSDGTLYQFVGPSPAPGDNPVGSTTGNWYGFARFGSTGGSGANGSSGSGTFGNPGSLTATAGDGNVTLQWPALSGTASYNVLRSNSSSGSYATIASDVAGLGYGDGGGGGLLTNGSPYFYVVTANPTGGGAATATTPVATATPLSLANLTPAMTSNTAPEGVASASAENAPAYMAFDHDEYDNSRYWDSGGATTATLEYEFAAARTVKRYAITQGYYGFGGPVAPNAWTMEGSNDSVSWTVLDTQSDQGGWASGEKRTYVAANTTAYLYYRLNMTVANNGRFVVGEWEMFAT